MEFNTPMDCLQHLKGELVEVTEKRKAIRKGKLVAFDLNTNLSLSTKDGIIFISGFDVESISQVNDA